MPWGQLVDEAERAVVVAGADLVEQGEWTSMPSGSPSALATATSARARHGARPASTRPVGQHLVLDDVPQRPPPMATSSSPTSTPARSAGEPAATATTESATGTADQLRRSPPDEPVVRCISGTFSKRLQPSSAPF